MEKEFVPYELAVKLKELRFDKPCITCYDKLKMIASHGKNVFDYKNYNTSGYMVSRPTFSQAFRWLLKEYNLYAIIIPTVTMHWTFKTMTVVEDIVEVPPYNHVDANDYSIHEEAELACLEKLIEIINNTK